MQFVQTGEYPDGYKDKDMYANMKSLWEKSKDNSGDKIKTIEPEITAWSPLPPPEQCIQQEQWVTYKIARGTLPDITKVWISTGTINIDMWNWQVISKNISIKIKPSEEKKVDNTKKA
jgi:hypothetical protein